MGAKSAPDRSLVQLYWITDFFWTKLENSGLCRETGRKWNKNMQFSIENGRIGRGLRSVADFTICLDTASLRLAFLQVDSQSTAFSLRFPRGPLRKK